MFCFHISDGMIEFVEDKHKFHLILVTKGERKGSGYFWVEDVDHLMDFPSPKETLLGEPYQKLLRLGYTESQWWANAVHELLHVWYNSSQLDQFSPNHSYLLQLAHTPLALCDMEEIVITGLQCYVNTGQVSPEMYKVIQSYKGDADQVLDDADTFNKWIIRALT